LLPVALFIAFWVALALIVFFVAGSGGPKGARAQMQTQSHRGSRAIAFTMLFLYVGFGVAIPLLFLHGNHANANAQVGGTRLTAAEKRGRQIFAFRCGLCHTLAAANTIGKVGPNLDQLKPGESLVLNTINNGCLQNPPANSPSACLGFGTMPAGIIQGRDAKDVAAFVAAIAGKE
jgi:mono/diheme cytochrome c family protein